jgi:hypothetical protein
MRLLMSAGEAGKKHRVEVNILDDEGGRVESMGGEIRAAKNPDLPAGWKESFLTVINIDGLRFETYGNYSFEVSVDGFSLKSIPLRIAKDIDRTT